MAVFLIVDDSSTLRKMIMAALRPLNATFNEASSGLEAIEHLALRPFDAVTLDLNMPDMHGLEFLRFIRGNSALKDTPVLVITSYRDEEIREMALSAGANRYITKPFAPDELLSSMKEILNG